jgi:hypothetical protein
MFTIYDHVCLPSFLLSQLELVWHLQYAQSSSLNGQELSGQTGRPVLESLSCFLLWRAAWCGGQWYPEICISQLHPRKHKQAHHIKFSLESMQTTRKCINGMYQHFHNAWYNTSVDLNWEGAKQCPKQRSSR